MYGVLLFANELGENSKLGPNTVFQNIIKNLPSKEMSIRLGLKFFIVFNKNYKLSFEIPDSIEKCFYLELPGYIAGSLEINKMVNGILGDYKLEGVKILYPKPVFLPLKAQQYSFLYDLAFEEIYQGKSEKDLKKKYFFKRIIWSKLKRIFTISFSSYQDINNLLGLKNLDWFYLGVDQEIFKVIDYHENRSFLEKFFYNEGLNFLENYFFYPAGKLWYRKNIVNLIRAFKIFCNKVEDNVFLVITANNLRDNNVYIKEVMKYTFEKVIFMENLEIEELVHLYNGCLAVVYPSFYEGFGLPILEGIACGKQILASKIKVFEEIYPSNEYWFNPSKIEDIADCMLNFYFKKDYYLSKRIINKAVIDKFKWSVTVEKLLEKMRE